MAGATLVVLLVVTLAGCFGAKELWSADLSKGNNGLFGIYGTVEDKENSIVLKRATGQNYAGSTYFAETDKNYDWNQGGMSVELSINLNTQDYEVGDYSVWSIALNETDGAYITENAVFFVGTSDGVKFISKAVGVETDYEALVNDEDAAVLTTGEYTVVFDYSTDDNGEIELEVELRNQAGQKVYESEEIDVTAIDHEGYTGGQVLKEENIISDNCSRTSATGSTKTDAVFYICFTDTCRTCKH